MIIECCLFFSIFANIELYTNLINFVLFILEMLDEQK